MALKFSKTIQCNHIRCNVTQEWLLAPALSVSQLPVNSKSVCSLTVLFFVTGTLFRLRPQLPLWDKKYICSLVSVPSPSWFSAASTMRVRERCCQWTTGRKSDKKPCFHFTTAITTSDVLITVKFEFRIRHYSCAESNTSKRRMVLYSIWGCRGNDEATVALINHQVTVTGCQWC